ncbi:hypothetical protein [Moraxella equi]|uniref:Uncharacterized protein n=1 Tax=Moraxella equi TaxID=60442 RepID=A0A378QSD1_9GAMM|nr:hypothetical protein [Moraxella equi]OPH34343.1 hypothetical protein B5J93_11890 [Moraxella equi]STZ03688.1 Uncharacterised protein [Moraxella equi]
MLTQLQLLEQTITELKARYNITATELANLKHKLAHDDSPRQISQLQLEISQSKDENNALHARIKELLSAQDELDKRLDELSQDNERLAKQNKDLTEKNALAISRAEVIQTWLSKIDNQNHQ